MVQPRFNPEKMITPNAYEHETTRVPSFKEVVEGVVKLTAENPTILNLMQVLASKMDSWESTRTIDADSAEHPDQKRIAQIVSWLTYSNDFTSIEEIHNFIEECIRNSVDGKVQRFSENTYRGEIKGEKSIRYRESRDQLLAVIEPFLKKFKPNALKGELNFWANAVLPSGMPSLYDKEDLEKNYRFKRTELGNVVVYGPDNLDEQVLNGIKNLSGQMDQIMQERSIDKGRLHVLLIPETRFSPRGGGASRDGRHILVDMSHPDKWRVYAHEYVHAVLAQMFGVSKIAAAVEGAAVFFAKTKFPLDPRNDYERNPWGFTDVVELAKQRQSVGLSPTEMLKKRGKTEIKKEEAYEYAYRFGGFLAEYIVTNFGREKYLEFYNLTCRDNLFDSTTGKPLIQNGQIREGVRQRDVIAQALRSTGLNPAQIEKNFDRLIKSRTLGKQFE